MHKISLVKQSCINTFFEGTKTWASAQERPEKKCIYARGVLMLILVGVIAFLNNSNVSAISSVSIAVPSRIDVELAPTSDGATNYQTGDVVVTSTETTGFKVMLSTTSNTTALTSKVASQDSVIPSITAATKLSSFPVNTWGVYLGASTPTTDTAFSPITTDQKQYITNTDTNASGTYKLAIGVKADTSLKAGNYSNDIVISIVATPKAAFSNITYMQDMTPVICAEAAEHQTTQLTDSRDGKTYWVTKLKDGRCWMTQNLALTFGYGTDKYGEKMVNKLTNGDSNLTSTSEWTSSSVYPLKDTEFGVPAVGGDTTYSTRSWDLGKWVLATPLLIADCGDANDMKSCVKVGFVDVSSSNFKPGYKATTRSWNGANANSNTLVAVNCTAWSGSGATKTCTSGTYDEHYLVGNYYTSNAATAGSNITPNVNAKDSICPKGWMLPNAGPQANGISGSFQNMLSQYGLASAISAGNYNIAKNPLYFVRGGMTDIASGRNIGFRNAGGDGYIWSSRPDTGSTFTYNLNIGSSVTIRLDYPFYGYSVRCVNAV